MLTKFLTYFGLALFLVPTSNCWASFQCQDLLTSRANVYRIPRTLRLMTYNVQNLYVEKERYIWGSETDIVENPKIKQDRHTREIARIITETAPDFVVLQEVETWNSIQRFIDNYLGEEYVAFMAGDYTERKINTVLLMKADLPLHVRGRPVSNITWTTASGNIEPVFARDLGVFEIFDPKTNRVVFAIFGVHYKSHRDRKNDPRSFLKRSQEAKVTAQLVSQFVHEHSRVPFVIAGDFNAEPDDPELRPLFEDLDIFDPLQNPNLFINKAKMGASTHSVHLRDLREARYSKIDLILTSNWLKDLVIGVDVYRYKDRETNTFKSLPSSNEERNENPSDHFPVFLDLRPEAIFNFTELVRSE
jgi:endonuclease/exonuclease/phosphatase family metal-dependent hydrolase